MKYDIEKLTRNFVPWFWQNSRNLALIDVLMGSLDAVNNSTLENENNALTRVGYSIQRLSLENSLNDEFDSTQSRIRIDNLSLTGGEVFYNEAETIDSDDERYLFKESETLPVDVDEVYLYNSSETESGATVGFTVFVPTEYMSIEQQIKNWINFVLIEGTSYNIVYE